MNSKIRLGIIGCGRAAELIYLPLLLKNTEIVVTAVTDPLKERRELISGNFHNCITAELLNDNVIQAFDAALISTPPDTHVSIAESLLQCNKHILVEKPLSLTIDDITNLVAASTKSKAYLMMAFNHRYWEPVNTLKAVLHQKSSNKNSAIAEIRFSGNYSRWNPVSFRSDSLDDLGSHVFDLIRYLFDQEIYSVSVNEQINNHFHLKIKTVEGINIHTFISHSDKTEKIIRIRCDAKEYFITLGSLRILPAPGSRRKVLDVGDRILSKALGRTSPIKRSYELQFERFINAIKSNKALKPDITDGIAAVQAAVAARLSMIRNEEIFLDEIK